MVAPAQPVDHEPRTVSTCIELGLQRFEDAWRAGATPAIDDFLPTQSEAQKEALLELVHTDLEYRLRSGEHARVEDYLARYQAIATDRDAVLDLMATEFEQRQRLTGPTVEEYLDRFPEYRAELLAAEPPRPAWGQRRSEIRNPNSQIPSPKSKSTRLGKYELGDLLGSGSFGTVYKAWDMELQRTVALKLPRAGSDASPEDAERLLKEARSAALLQHPGIVALYEGGQVNGTCWLACEFIAGQTLAQYSRRGPLTLREVAALVADVADALQYAHSKGVIHRDIKPSNILIDEAGKPHLADFGLAKRTLSESLASCQGQVLGTPAYMSPEQARGERDKIDPLSDVYSLGVVLYELLTAEVPFRGDAHMVLRQVVEEEPTPPRRMIASISRDLENICLQAMNKKPACRYPSAAAFADDLRRFLDGRPVKARPVSAAARAWRWCRRRPLPAFLIAALSLTLIGGVGTSTVLWRQAEAESKRLKWQRDRSVEELDRAESIRQGAITQLRTYCEQENNAPSWVREKLHEMCMNHTWAGLESVRRSGLDEPRIRSLIGAYRVELARLMLPTKNVPALGGQPNYQHYPAMPRDLQARLDEGRKVWTEMLAELPHTPEVRLDRVRCLLAAADSDTKVEDAIQHLKQALEIAEALELERKSTWPLLARSYLRLAEARRWSGRLDQAVAVLHEACDWPKEHPELKLGPAGIFREDQRIDCYVNLAELYLEMNQREQARSFARQAETLLDHYPSPKSQNLDAELRREARALAKFLDGGKLTEAYDTFQDLFRLFNRSLTEGGVRANQKMQLESFGTRLQDLQCGLGDAPE
jgi:serine/threonine protein kinase/tetratricopeptide (TPR) repeat protein